MGAWAQRCAENGDVIPSNVALDGTVPKWWGAQQHSVALAGRNMPESCKGMLRTRFAT